MKTKKYLIGLLGLLSFGCFLSLMFAVATHATLITTFDQTIYDWVIPHRTTFYTQALLVLTTIGSPPVVTTILILLALGFWVRGYHNAALFLITNGIVISGANSLIKQLIHRLRPFLADPTIHALQHPGGYSFPSGHSSGAVIVYGSLLLLTWHLGKHISRQWLATVASIIMIGLIGISRIYLQVHYPSDVIGGFLLGISGLCLTELLFGPLLNRKVIKKHAE